MNATGGAASSAYQIKGHHDHLRIGCGLCGGSGGSGRQDRVAVVAGDEMTGPGENLSPPSVVAPDAPRVGRASAWANSAVQLCWSASPRQNSEVPVLAR